MAGQIVSLTEGVVSGTASGTQDGTKSLEFLSGIGRLDLLIKVYVVAKVSAAASGFTLTLQGSMYRTDNAADWVDLTSATDAGVASGSILKLSANESTGLYRYSRWKFTTSNVANIAFEITGVAW